MFFIDLPSQIVEPYPCLLKNKQWRHGADPQENRKGWYSLGETIVPQTFTRTFVKDGKIKSEERSVSGRKFSLIQIRKDLLQKHSDYMRLTTDEEFSKMEKKDLIEILKNIGEFDAKGNEKSFKDLLTKVKKFERTRYLACWHDDSSVGNHSHLLVTVNVLYDTVSSCQITNII